MHKASITYTMPQCDKVVKCSLSCVIAPCLLMMFFTENGDKHKVKRYVVETSARQKLGRKLSNDAMKTDRRLFHAKQNAQA